MFYHLLYGQGLFIYSATTGVVTRAGLRSARRNKEPVKFLGGNKKAKVIVLQIDGLTSDVSLVLIFS